MAETTTLDSGPELDGLVAELVLGKQVRRGPGYNNEVLEFYGNYEERNGLFATPKPYSSDIAKAWQVVERMREHPNAAYRTLHIVAYPYGRTYASFRGHETDEWCEANRSETPNGEGDPTPLAICRAALEIVRECSGLPHDSEKV